MAGDYQPVGDQSQWFDFNPQWGQRIESLIGQAGTTAGSIQKLIEGADPGAGLSAFLSAAPAFQGLSKVATEPYLDLADIQAERGMEQVLATHAGAQSLYSGGAIEDLIRAQTEPRMQAVRDIAQMGTGLTQTLFGALPSMISTYPQVGLQGANILGGMYGTQMGAAAPAFEQQLAEPTYADQNAWIRDLLGGLMGAGGMLGGAALGGLFG